MLKTKWFYFLIILLIGASFFIYKKCHVPQVKDEAAFFMKAPKKEFGVLMITSGIPDSQNMASGIVCVENAPSVNKIDLFMPDMGHGSEPPKVTSSPVPKEFFKYNNSVPNFGCYTIESMQLFMPGMWQVRVFYKEGAMGIFTVNLEK